ncbi:MAG TPA: methyltransferase domain-containing protein [Kofleriaceae bacterium]
MGDLTAAEVDELAALGARLRDAGLHARGLAAWAGMARLSALPARLDALPAGAPTPAAAILALFIAGTEVERERLRTLPEAAIDQLAAWQLLDRNAGLLRARVAILPLGAALLVCDRLDAPIEQALVCWPDDSSHHLATAIPPGRRTRWLDLGCGSAFAPLARPELAHQIAGVDINPRAVRHARLGAALSGLSQLTISPGDIDDLHEPADLVTCNAPMPDPPGDGDRLRTTLPEVWRRTDPDFFTRLWPALARAVRPGGMAVVHAAAASILPALADVPGERVVVTYTPDGVPGFAVAWWHPDAPPRLATARRALTPERPHLDPRDRDDALAPQ